MFEWNLFENLHLFLISGVSNIVCVFATNIPVMQCLIARTYGLQWSNIAINLEIKNSEREKNRFSAAILINNDTH